MNHTILQQAIHAAPFRPFESRAGRRFPGRCSAPGMDRLCRRPDGDRHRTGRSQPLHRCDACNEARARSTSSGGVDRSESQRRGISESMARKNRRCSASSATSTKTRGSSQRGTTRLRAARGRGSSASRTTRPRTAAPIRAKCRRRRAGEHVVGLANHRSSA